MTEMTNSEVADPIDALHTLIEAVIEDLKTEGQDARNRRQLSWAIRNGKRTMRVATGAENV